MDHLALREWFGRGRRLSQRLCLAAILTLCLLTAGRLFWQLEHFRNLGPVFYPCAVFVFVILFLASAWYSAGFSSFLRGVANSLRPAILLLLVPIILALYAPGSTAVVASVFLACYSFGFELLCRLHLTSDSSLEKIVLSTGLGLGVLTFALFLIGLAHAFYPVVFGLLLLVFAIVGQAHIRRAATQFKLARQLWAFRLSDARPMAGIAWLFATILILCALPVIIAPSIAFDVLRYHLPAARFYSLGHSLIPVPLSDYSYYPQGMEVLMTMAYSLSGQVAAQMITPAVTALFTVVVYRILRRCQFSPAAALTGVVCAFSLPFVHWSGAVAKNDSALGMYQALSVLCVLQWHQSRKLNWVLLGAFFLGSSFGIKHVALFGAVPLAALFLYAAVSQKRWIRATLLLGAVLVVSGTFWQMRTFLLTGSPVYPEGTFRVIATSVVVHHDSFTGSIWRYLSVPWEVLWAGQRSFESPLLNPSGIVLLVLAPVWLFVRRLKPNRAEQICLGFSLAYLLYWCTAVVMVRYAIFPLCLLAGLSGARLYILSAEASWPGRVVLCSAFAYCEIFSLTGIMIIELNVPQLRFLAGRIDQHQYLREALQTYDSLTSLAAVTKPGDRVLGIENCSAFYAPENVEFNCVLVNDAASRRDSDLGNRLRQDHYRFVVSKNGPKEAAVLELLESNTRTTRLGMDQNFSVYRIDP